MIINIYLVRLFLAANMKFLRLSDLQ